MLVARKVEVEGEAERGGKRMEGGGKREEGAHREDIQANRSLIILVLWSSVQNATGWDLELDFKLGRFV